MLDDHAGEPVGDGNIDGFQFLLLLECLCNVAQHQDRLTACFFSAKNEKMVCDSQRGVKIKPKKISAKL